MSDRLAADEFLQDSINAEQSARIDADLAEQSARIDADLAEQSARIAADLLEKSARIIADGSIQAALSDERAERQNADASEQSYRVAADNILRADIDAEKTVREAADSAIQSALVSESLSRQNADASLQNNLTAEIVARQSADTAESAARIAADASLRTDINAEKSAREIADIALQNAINAEIAARQAAILTEKSARLAAETAIQNNSNIDPAALDSLSEVVSAFQSADSNIQNTIAALAANGSANIEAETSARQASDIALQNGIVSEQSRAESAEALLRSEIDAEIANRSAAVAGEQAAREGADEELQNNIDTEAAARAAAVMAEKDRAEAAEQALQLKINAEEDARKDADLIEKTERMFADAALQAAIDTETINRITAMASEEEARISADMALQDSINAEAAARAAAVIAEADAREVAIATEKNRSEAAESELQAKIDIEESARIIAVAAEQARAELAESGLRFDLNTEISDRNGAVSALRSDMQADNLVLNERIDIETAARVAGDISMLNDAKAYADQKVADLVNSAPMVLDTLKELSDAINGDANFAATVAGQVGAVQSNLDAEKTRSIVAENKLASDIAAEEAARIAALSVEKTRALVAEAELQASILALENATGTELVNQINILEQKIDSEKTVRAIADNAIQDTIYIEKTDRIAAISLLQERMDAEESARIATISEEQFARESADIVLQNNLAAEISARDSSVAAEKSRAESAEGALQAGIAAEEQARIAAISAEAANRAAADSVLSGRLDIIEGIGAGSVIKAEADSKAYADQKIAELINSAPAVLDTLKELSDAINGDANFAATVAGQIGAVQDSLNVEKTRASAAEQELALNIAAEESARILNISTEKSRALIAEANLLNSIAGEATAREAADVALDARLDNVELTLGTSVISVFENSASVYADAFPGIQDPNYRAGWYFKNLAQGQKVNWYFFDGQAENVSLGDFSGYAIITFDSLVSKPHLAVYTMPTGSGDAGSWYKSRVVYIANQTPIAGVKYLMHFGQDPKVHPELPRLTMSSDNVSTRGTRGATERVLTAALGSDSGTSANNCQFVAEAVGVYSTAVKRKTKLEIRLASKSSLDLEASSRASADVVIQNSINSVSASVVNETSARAAADSVLQGRASAIENSLNQEITDRIASVFAERSRAEAAEAALQAGVSAIEVALQANIDAEHSARQDAVLIEQSARIAGDAVTLISANSYTDGKVSALVNSAPAVLDTLKELADALGGDANFAASVAGQIGSVASDLAAEASRAQSSETALAVAIAAEADNRAQDMAQEILAREAAQSALSADIADEMNRAMAVEESLDAKIDDETFNRSEADTILQLNINSLDNRLDVMDIIDNTKQISMFENNASVYADAFPGIQDPNNRDGWYFKNLAQGQKVNWYFFDGQAENVSLGDFSAYAIVTFDSLVSKPHLAVYTIPTGAGDAGSWYKSRVVYVSDSSAVAGVKYLMHFGQDPKVHPELPRLSMTTSSSSIGVRANSERVMTAALGSDSGTSANNCQFVAEAVGVYSTNIKRKVSFKIRATSKADLAAEQSSRTAAISSALNSANSYTNTQVSALTTSNISEGSKLYFTDLRAKTAAVVDTMAGLETDRAASVSSMKTYLTQYLKKGPVIWCLPGGEYSSLQAAIDAAVPGQVILLGEGSWGNATLKGKVDIVGLGSPRNTHITVGCLTFAPTSGSAVDNEIFLSNILINGTSTESGVTVGGTAPVRFNMSGCYVYRGSGASTLVNITNTNTSATTVRMDGCIINSSSSDGILISSTARYLRITNSDMYNASKALVVNSGLAQVALSGIETNSASEVIQIASGASCAVSTSLIRNLTANGSGVSVATNGSFAVSTLAMFDIASGTGYCIKGTGTVVYDFVSFNHIAVVQPRNLKFQNTLTIIQLPSTPSVVS